MEYKIRKTAEGDLPKLAMIMKESFKLPPWNESWESERCLERLSDIFHMPSSVAFTLVDEKDVPLGALLGFLLPRPEGKEATLLECFVDPSYMGKGLGSTLMQGAMLALEESGVRNTMFYTSGTLDSFYSKFGFKRSENCYLMTKEK